MERTVNRLTVYFSGHVQGVGFRSSVLQVARGFVVAGTVANMADGRVRLEAEGDADELEAFLTAVKDALSGYIRKTEEAVASVTPGFRDFMILPDLI